ncbi:MAG: hypothetical protein M3Z09_12045 [Acidobacteriota bacterium]|nr:hypothetical protein [Acidobacteriota bacterium]
MLKRLAVCFLPLALLVLAGTAGNYTGTWTSDASGSGGKLMLTFSGTDLTQASFSYQGQDVKTKPVSLKIIGNQVDVIFEYDLNGSVLRSRMTGTLTGKTIKGKYQSANPDGSSPVDEGAWEVTQQ